MNVTMGDIIAFRNNVDYFSNTTLPLKTAYKLNKIKKAVEKETEFYGEKFQEILDTYAQKEENGNYVMSEDGTQILIVEGKVDECNKALDELQSMEVEVDTYGLTLEELGDVQCTPEQLEAIMPFFE